MPSDVTRSASLALADAVGDQLAAVFDAEGYTGDDRVWKSAPRAGTEYPYALYETREQPSLLMGNKDDDPVRGVAEVQVFGQDDVTVAELATAAQEALCDDDAKPTVTGFRVVWHDLVFNQPLNDLRADAPDIYGRVLEVEYELDPN